MRRPLLTLAGVALVISVFCVATFAPAQSRSGASAWEYKIIEAPAISVGGTARDKQKSIQNAEKVLNDYGRDGWQHAHSAGRYWVMKRDIR